MFQLLVAKGQSLHGRADRVGAGGQHGVAVVRPAQKFVGSLGTARATDVGNLDSRRNIFLGRLDKRPKRHIGAASC